jgi:hypothetical protein
VESCTRAQSKVALLLGVGPLPRSLHSEVAYLEAGEALFLVLVVAVVITYTQWPSW